MADNVGYTPGVGATVAADEISGVLHQRIKIGVGGDGVAVDVSSANPMPVTGTVSTGLSQPLTDTQLRATPVPVSGTVTANTGLSQPLTDSQLRASPVPITGSVSANTGLSQPLTDTQLRATAVSVVGPLTDSQLRASPVPVSVGSIALPSGASTSALQITGNTSLSNIDGKIPSLVSGRIPVDGSGVTQPVSGTVTANTGLSQPVTDTQLRASPVPVSGSFYQATQPVSIASSVAVTGPLTDTQLRATAVPVSVGSIALPTGASTLAEQQSQTALLGTIDADTGSISTSASSIDGKTPALVSGRVPVDGSGVTQPVSIASSVAVTGPLTDTQLRATPVPVSGTFYQTTQPVSIAASVAVTGPLTDAQLRATPVPVSGTVTANTGLTQPLTDTQLRATAVPVSAASLPLPSGAATEATLGNVLTTSAFNTRTPALGQATMAASTPVVIASDQSAVPTEWADAALTTYTQTGAIATNTVLMTLDMLNYGGAAIQVVSLGTSGALTAEWSIDGSTWVNSTINSPTGSTLASATFTSGMWNLSRQARYLRIRLSTGTTAGTTTVYAERYVALFQYWYNNQGVTLNSTTAVIGDVGIQYRANASGAATINHLVSGGTTNPTVVKATSGRVVGWSFTNTNAAYRYIKLHNQNTTPTAGTGVVATIALPPNAVATYNINGGIAFTSGIAFTTVTGSADSNNTAVGAGDIVGDFFYA